MNNYLKVVELLQTKLKRAVVPIVGKAISVMFGTVSENGIKIIRRKLKNIEEDQKVLAQKHIDFKHNTFGISQKQGHYKLAG